MSFFKFKKIDKIDTSIVAIPTYSITLQGDAITGSLYLERPYLNSALNSRIFHGFSENEGGLVDKVGPFTASISFTQTQKNGLNKQLWNTINNLYRDYSIINTNYTASYNGSSSLNYNVMFIPETYYDRAIVTGTFTASAPDASGTMIKLYDDGMGGIYSGSQSGSILGNIFYSEGVVVLKASNLYNFGSQSTSNFKWNICFAGQQTIPVNIWRCKAPAGQLNASTNTTFYYTPLSGVYQSQRQIVSSSLPVYITTVGLYNQNYELVGIAKLAQPIRKDLESDLEIRIRIDR